MKKYPIKKEGWVKGDQSKQLIKDMMEDLG